MLNVKWGEARDERPSGDVTPWGVNLTARAPNHSDRNMVKRGGGIVGRTRNSTVGRGDAPRKKGFRASYPDPVPVSLKS